MNTKTKSQIEATNLNATLRARNPLIWVTTREEARVEQYLVEAALAAGYVPRTWDVGQGVASLDGKPEQIGGPDPGMTLDAIRDRTKPGVSKPERGVWIMRDLPAWLSGPGGVTTLRQVRNLARLLPGVPRDQAQALIVISPSGDVPPELVNHTTLIEWPLPDRAEIAAILDAAIESLPEEIRKDAAPNGTRDAAIDAAVGLSGEEAQACYARSLVQLKKIDVAVIAGEKKRIVERDGLLEWLDPLPGGLDSVGGLDNIKAWLKTRTNAYSLEARAYGLPAPKGMVLVGVSGCGKTLTSKAVSTAWQCPLVRLDLGALKSKFVGESEGKLRGALKTIEALGKCVVQLDEVEKSLQGATSGSADGGVSADALGTILSWMQDRGGQAFVIATANDVSALPPEFLRKGRFDELWFVDLPNRVERGEILLAALRQNGRSAGIFQTTEDIRRVADACEGFTGAEIAAIVPDALYTAFADGAREVSTVDLIDAAGTVVPLSETAKEKIEALRAWAATRARRATAPIKEEQTRKRVRELDVA